LFLSNFEKDITLTTSKLGIENDHLVTNNSAQRFHFYSLIKKNLRTSSRDNFRKLIVFCLLPLATAKAGVAESSKTATAAVQESSRSNSVMAD
jgi:hypothetical protein